MLASLAGFGRTSRTGSTSLELVQDLIVAGLGVGLLPRGRPSLRGVSVVRLRDPEVRLRAYAVTRRGRGTGRRCRRSPTGWSPAEHAQPRSTFSIGLPLASSSTSLSR